MTQKPRGHLEVSRTCRNDVGTSIIAMATTWPYLTARSSAGASWYIWLWLSPLGPTKCLNTLVCCQWAYGSSLKQLYPHYLGQMLGFWLTCWVKLMSLCHGWGWQPPQTTSHIRFRHIQSVWAHWYAVHGHMAVASNSYTHTTWVIFWGSGSLVESKWYHYIMVEAESHIKLLPTSTLDIYKVLKHIDMLSMGKWQ